MKKLFLLFAAIVTIVLGASAQTRTYTGTVLDAEENEPVVGATVTPVGGGHATMTDVDGNFTLSVPASVKEVTVTFVGMTSVTAPLKDGMKVFLSTNATMLDAVVVTGYGSGKKLGSVVGAVNVVGNETFEKTPSTSFVDALQGQVPGLAIYSNSGDPSSTNNAVYLRGMNSLTASNAPLYILDGAPVSSSMFNTLPPADIESITVLKDAASTAIYGTRAANGVIVITTKKGKYGEKSKVTIRANYGWSQMVADNVEMMNAQQYVQFRDIIGVPVSGQVRNLVDNYGISTNWRDQFFHTAPMYSLEGVVQGGTEKLTYFLSLNHYDQEGIVDHAGIRRESLRFNLDSKVNDWFRVGLRANLGYAKWETNASSDALYGGDGLYLDNPMIAARMALPYDSPYYYTFDNNGNIVYGDKAYKLHYSGMYTPGWGYVNTKNNRDRITANVNLYEEITPIKGLRIRAQQAVEGYDARQQTQTKPYKSYRTPMGDKMGSAAVGVLNPGSAGKSFSRYYQFTYTNTAEYIHTFAEKHNMSLLIGQESIISRASGFVLNTSGQTDPRMLLLQQGNVKPGAYSESLTEESMNSYFLTGSYDYDNRYFVDFSVRRDGSSLFAPENRWGTFGSVGVMWNLKNEKFLTNVNWLSDLKLRYSYGKTGNAGINPYQWEGLIGAYTTGYGGSGATGLASPGNSGLTWETVTSHDLGISAAFLDSRLRATLDIYSKTTHDMLSDVPYSLTTGVSSQLANVAEMSNKGFEIELSGDIFKNKDWYVGARVLFAYNRNRIEKLWDGAVDYPMPNYSLNYKIGHDAHEYYSVRYVGVDPADGKQMWLDKNDNVTKVFPSDAQVMTGKVQMAPWTGGFGANVRWKDLSVSANFNFAINKYMMNNDNYFIRNSAQGTSFNQCVDMLNIWTTPGQVTDIPAFGEVLRYAGEDTGSIEDASFMRLKNLTVSYNIPKTLVNRWGMEAIQFHFTGRNLWTVTDFTGYDPEPASNYVQFQFPNTRQYELGVEVTF